MLRTERRTKMPDSKSTDHWKFLAQQLGAASDTGWEEATEEAKPAEPVESVEPSAVAAEPELPFVVAAEIPELQPESAPAADVYRHFGLTVDNLVATVQAVLSRESKS